MRRGLDELRSALANLRAAAEALEVATPQGASRRQTALLRVVVAEAARASDALSALPPIEGGEGRHEIRLPVLVREVMRRVDSECGLRLAFDPSLAPIVEVDGELEPALASTLCRLRREFAISEVVLAVRLEGSLVSLDFSWPTDEPASDLLRATHTEVLAAGRAGEPSLREAARAAGGEAWIALRRGGERGSLRVLLAARTQSNRR